MVVEEANDQLISDVPLWRVLHIDVQVLANQQRFTNIRSVWTQDTDWKTY